MSEYVNKIIDKEGREYDVQDARIADASQLATKEEVSAKADASTVETALAAKADLVDGKVPVEQLPELGSSDVEMDNDFASFPVTGDAAKIYIAKDTNKQYRWNGSTYSELSEEDKLTTIDWNGSRFLTDAEVNHLVKGKAIIWNHPGPSYNYGYFRPQYTYTENDNQYMHLVRMSAEGLTFGDTRVPNSYKLLEKGLKLSVAEKKLYSEQDKNITGSDLAFISDSSNNFFDGSTDPNANGKKIVREMNVAGKLVPTYATTDANKALVVNAQGTGLEFAQVGDSDVEVLHFYSNVTMQDISLTAAQIEKAKKGKLVIYRQYNTTALPAICQYIGSNGFDNTIAFAAITESHYTSASYVPGKASRVTDYMMAFYTTTGECWIDSIQSSSPNLVTDESTTFFENDAVISSSGKRIVREKNIYGKLVPSYASSDADKVLKVNSNGDGLEFDTISGGGLTAQEVQDMIDASIGDALNVAY